jgi:hypothetical protein
MGTRWVCYGYIMGLRYNSSDRYTAFQRSIQSGQAKEDQQVDKRLCLSVSNLRGYITGAAYNEEHFYLDRASGSHFYHVMNHLHI